jgi:hypothetical protein
LLRLHWLEFWWVVLFGPRLMQRQEFKRPILRRKLSLAIATIAPVTAVVLLRATACAVIAHAAMRQQLHLAAIKKQRHHAAIKKQRAAARSKP